MDLLTHFWFNLFIISIQQCISFQIDEVIPKHSPKFAALIKKCREAKETVSINEVVYCTRFVSTFILLRVKATRPQSIFYLTLEHIEKAHVNGGFVDATQFKTAEQYIYDSLKFTEGSLTIIDQYIKYVRPLCNPDKDCPYVLLTTRGTQFQSIGFGMRLLVYQTISKHIHPTRYRQIIETASEENLTPAQQKVVNRYQCHSSTVAQRFVYSLISYLLN